MKQLCIWLQNSVMKNIVSSHFRLNTINQHYPHIVGSSGYDRKIAMTELGPALNESDVASKIRRLSYDEICNSSIETSRQGLWVERTEPFLSLNHFLQPKLLQNAREGLLW
jgi:hypothetical protein